MNEKMWSYFIQVLKSETHSGEWSEFFSKKGDGFVSDSGVACLPIRNENDLEAGESLGNFYQYSKEPWRLLLDNSTIANGQIQEIIDGEELRTRLNIS